MHRLVIDLGEPLPDYPRTKPVSLVVIHESVTNTRAAAVAVLQRRRLGVHYTVERDGSIEQHVPDLMACAHAGTGRNQRSIAIEVINRYYGRYAEASQTVIDAIWAHKGRYILPTGDQVRAVWRLVEGLIRQLGWQDRTDLWPGPEKVFRWGRVPDVYTGISAHHRWHHADGLFIEHYCRCRHAGQDHETAWDATVAAASSGQRETRFAPS